MKQLKSKNNKKQWKFPVLEKLDIAETEQTNPFSKTNTPSEGPGFDNYATS